ncbi:hypothetical protein CAPTEDRAFT_191752 [Capitella teleta]|uniref:Carbohydrate sulfotransferase n=1 Tax=Capitella teleta TaxID=283909 RepID=R7TY80_CAPTE|nr:hypothetical protein CAPTEDRAFT_191752 [Capitella teleta]|eukprot:ELT98704.1 hypothetical protein CAPTEDRAFT_191752 [Capitella teleta]
MYRFGLKSLRHISLACGVFVLVYYAAGYLLGKRNSQPGMETQPRRTCSTQERVLHVKSMCRRPPQTLDSRNLSLFLVDEVHKIVYCAVPKAATTSFKTLFATWTGEVNDLLAHQVESEMFLSSIGLRYLHTFSSERIREILKDYYAMLIVRHPLERLVSAFRDKIKRMTSYDYILSEDKASRDPHWKLMSAMCFPCDIDYDFVGKVETLNDDMRTFQKMFQDAPILQKLNSRVHKEEMRQSFVIKEMMKLTSVQVKSLKQMYSDDMDMFGYSLSFLRRPLCGITSSQCC